MRRWETPQGRCAVYIACGGIWQPAARLLARIIFLQMLYRSTCYTCAAGDIQNCVSRPASLARRPASLACRPPAHPPHCAGAGGGAPPPRHAALFSCCSWSTCKPNMLALAMRTLTGDMSRERLSCRRGRQQLGRVGPSR